MTDRNKPEILAALAEFRAALTKAGYDAENLTVISKGRDPLFPRAPRMYAVAQKGASTLGMPFGEVPSGAGVLIAMLQFATAALSLPRDVKLDVLHSRDPDSECYHEFWVNNEPVQPKGYEDVDPGRGYQRSDWNERIRSYRGDDSPFGKAVLEALRVASDSQYIDGDDGEREDVTTAKHNDDVNHKNQALAAIRERYPTATVAHFSTTDREGCYGFTFGRIDLADGSRVVSPGFDDELFEWWDGVDELVTNLDWDDAMGEDPHGHAELTIAAKYVTVSLDIDNAYETHEALTCVTDVTVPAPDPDLADDEAENHEAAFEEVMNEWARTALFPFTGTEHTEGNSTYAVKITACSDPSLVGESFDL